MSDDLIARFRAAAMADVAETNDEVIEGIAHDYQSWMKAMEAIRTAENWPPRAYPSMQDRWLFAAQQQRIHEMEFKYRRLLWLVHGHRGIYGDDGEMQCGECAKFGCDDYKRAPLVDVERAAAATRLERITWQVEKKDMPEFIKAAEEMAKTLGMEADTILKTDIQNLRTEDK
jgi:hypothetical protein